MAVPNALFDTMPELPPLAARLAPRLRALAERGVYFGTSSWRYEGWLGSIYHHDRYVTRGKFSRAKFGEDCLREYAATFPVAGGDFSFYTVPNEAYWDRCFANLPDGFGFGLKVPEQFTVRRWPNLPRAGKQAGQWNPGFLDAKGFAHTFLRPLLAHRKRVAVLMFEFGTFSPDIIRQPGEFREQLQPFLERLPAGWRYAVEVRNPEFLEPEHFRLLGRFNVAHVLNAWTRMPTLSDQLRLPGVHTADFSVVRALLKRGRPYEQAVKLFEPYRMVQQPDLPTRQGICDVARRALAQNPPAYIFVNNRLEGNSPQTIEAVVNELEV
jgi:uncharacterized protein YecE (DUF72 family)